MLSLSLFPTAKNSLGFFCSFISLFKIFNFPALSSAVSSRYSAGSATLAILRVRKRFTVYENLIERIFNKQARINQAAENSASSLKRNTEETEIITL